jgi:hypothetical protein
MRWLLLALLALLAALVQHTVFGLGGVAPDLTLALAAWALVDGDDGTVPLRLFLIGALRDLVAPGSEAFHASVLLILAVLFWPARRLLLRRHPLGWAGAGVLLALALPAIDAALYSAGGMWFSAVVWSAVLTGIAAVGCGWTFGGLPGRWRPVAAAGA